MNVFEMILSQLGITPAILEDTQKLFVQIAQNVEAMQAQLTRIEHNTFMLLEQADGTVPAAPTDYERMPRLDHLPPMTGEAEGAHGPSNGS